MEQVEVRDLVIESDPGLRALCVAISINLLFTKIFRMMWYEGRAQPSSVEHLPSISSANTDADAQSYTAFTTAPASLFPFYFSIFYDLKF